MIIFSVHILIFTMGVVLGSFLNVLAYRLPRRIPWVKLGSHCPNCNIPIPWKYKIPILSYIYLEGKCWNCHHSIPRHYPLVEFSSGVITWLLFQHFGFTPEFVFYLIFALGLILISIIDLKEMIIPNSVLIVLLALGIIINLVFYIQPWGNALQGMGIALGSMMAIGFLGKVMFGQEAMGMGDIKLSGVAGFFLGGDMIIYAIFFSFIIAFLAILFMLLVSRVQKRDVIPFGPFLSIALVSFVLWGNTIIQWYWALFS